MTKPPIGRDTRLCMSLSARPGNAGSRLHNHLYDALGLDYVYKAFATTDLAAAVLGMRALDIRGSAISMPFKEAVIPLIDRLDASASGIASVNTLVNDSGVITGHNTDYGAVRDLLEHGPAHPVMPFVLRGSGGMAKAVAAALFDAGFRNGTIVARNAHSGAALAQRHGYRFATELPDGGAALLINVTPLGMEGPQANAMAFPRSMIAAAEVAFDVVAQPPRTPFILAAQALGKAVISGTEVIVRQSVEQFVLYTGVRPDAAQIVAATRFAHGDAAADQLALALNRA